MTFDDKATHTPRAANAQASRDNFTRDLFAWLNQIKADATLPPSAFKVAFEIGQYLNRDTGEAWPSTERIGNGIAMSQATVIAMVGRLKANGHLAVDPGCRGRGHSHRYRLILKPQQAEVSETPSGRENLSPLSENLSPLSSKPQPADMNHLIEPSEEPSEGEPLSPPPDLFIDAAVESPPAPTIKPPDAAFDRFWAIYPRRVAKGAARRAFAKALKQADAETLIEGARRYGAETAGREPRFVAHAATWLNGERWLDEPARANGGALIDQWGNPAGGRAVAPQGRRRGWVDIVADMQGGGYERH